MLHLAMDDHILVQFPGKKAVKFYVGKIIQLDCDDDEVETAFFEAGFL